MNHRLSKTLLYNKIENERLKTDIFRKKLGALTINGDFTKFYGR